MLRAAPVTSATLPKRGLLAVSIGLSPSSPRSWRRPVIDPIEETIALARSLADS